MNQPIWKNYVEQELLLLEQCMAQLWRLTKAEPYEQQAETGYEIREYLEKSNHKVDNEVQNIIREFWFRSFSKIIYGASDQTSKAVKLLESLKLKSLQARADYVVALQNICGGDLQLLHPEDREYLSRLNVESD